MSLLLILLAMAPDAPTTASAPAAPAAAPATQGKDRIVCERSRSASLGSNIVGKRVCRKKSEMDAEAEHTRRNLRKFQDHRSDPTKIPGARAPTN